MKFRLVSFFIMLSSILKLIGCINPSKNNGVISSKDSIDTSIEKSVEEFKNRPIYSRMTAEIIDSTSDDQLLQIVFDNLCEKISEGYTREFEEVSSFSKNRQFIYVIWVLEAEVNNGGFNQFYYNPSGKFAPILPEALRMVGAIKFSNLVERANAMYKRDYDKITKYQDGSLEGFSKSYIDNPLNELDTEFYDLNNEEDLNQIQVDYIRSHKKDFVD